MRGQSLKRVLGMPDWDDERDSQRGVVTESKQKVEKPPLYKVLLHNDNYTTMEFVVFILKTVFHKSDIDAVKIMMSVHKQGIGVAGVFTCEIAEAKIAKVTDLARANDYPLLCTMEKE